MNVAIKWGKNFVEMGQKLCKGHWLVNFQNPSVSMGTTKSLSQTCVYTVNVIGVVGQGGCIFGSQNPY